LTRDHPDPGLSLVCAECGALAEGNARGWQGYLVDLEGHDGSDEVLPWSGAEVFEELLREWGGGSEAAGEGIPFVMGDLSREEYAQKRALITEELAAHKPPSPTDATDAAAALTSFSLFWQREEDAHERNRLLRVIFETVTQDDGRIVAVAPRQPFLPYFQRGGNGGREERERRDSNPRLSPHRDPGRSAASHPTSHKQHGERRAGASPRKTNRRVLQSREPRGL
jgi:hypothetical protein